MWWYRGAAARGAWQEYSVEAAWRAMQLTEDLMWRIQYVEAAKHSAVADEDGWESSDATIDVTHESREGCMHDPMAMSKNDVSSRAPRPLIPSVPFLSVSLADCARRAVVS